jgi:hypothetical protein
MDIMNTSGILYQAVVGWTGDVSGNLWVTFFILMILLIVIGIMFRLPIDLIFLITLPFPFIIFVYNPAFAIVMIIYLVYAGLLLFRIIRAMLSGY